MDQSVVLESNFNLKQVPQSTVTIWGSFGDEVDVGQLLDLIDSIGSDRVVSLILSEKKNNSNI